jgi:hypothetical protein
MAWNQAVPDCQMSSHLATIQGKTGIPARPQCHEKATLMPSDSLDDGSDHEAFGFEVTAFVHLTWPPRHSLTKNKKARADLTAPA